MLHQYHSAPQILHNRKIYFEPHLHEEIEIIALYQGSACLTADGMDHPMQAGDFVLVFPNTVHSYRAQGEVEVGKFIFPPDLLPEVKGVFSSQTTACPVVPGARAQSCGLERLSKEILDQYDGCSATVQRAYLLLLTARLLEMLPLEPRRGDSHLLSQIFAYCQENFRRRITQKEVAQALHISESHLSHLFGGRLKINFCQYVNSLRINEASRLLRQSDLGVLQIAEESGFSSLRSFNRVFAAQRGMSPRAYRNRL